MKKPREITVWGTITIEYRCDVKSDDYRKDDDYAESIENCLKQMPYENVIPQEIEVGCVDVDTHISCWED